MKIAVKLDEGEIKAAIRDWLENATTGLNASEWEDVQVNLYRDPHTGKFVAECEATETFDATETVTT